MSKYIAKPYIHNLSRNDANYIINSEDKVHSVRFINQGKRTVLINNNLMIPPFSDFEFKANENFHIQANFSITFVDIENVPGSNFLKHDNNLVIVLMRE